MEDLANENINLNGFRTAPGRSGACLIMVDGKGNRGILVDPGVNDTISMSDIDQELANKARLIHFTSFACRNAETSFETQKELASGTSAEISLDPGTLYAERGMKALMIFIQKARVVLPGDHELALMTGCRGQMGGCKTWR
jgi:ribokinase